MIFGINADDYALGQSVEAAVKRGGQMIFIGRLFGEGPSDGILFGAVSRQHHLGPFNVDALAFREDALGDIDDSVNDAVGKLSLEPDIFLRLRVIAKHYLTHAAIIAGSDPYSVLVVGQRTDLGTNPKVFVKPQALIDLAGKIGCGLKLGRPHAWACIPEHGFA